MKSIARMMLSLSYTLGTHVAHHESQQDARDLLGKRTEETEEAGPAEDRLVSILVTSSPSLFLIRSFLIHDLGFESICAIGG